MLIGITGGIGSGKSTIAEQLRHMGYDVYDTDKEAKRIITEDLDVRHKIEALLGEETYKDGVYQTAFVAQKVFAIGRTQRARTSCSSRRYSLALFIGFQRHKQSYASICRMCYSVPSRY